jgi:hypothetical protein
MAEPPVCVRSTPPGGEEGHPVPKQSLPDTCPKCQGSRVVGILWCYRSPYGKEAADIANKRALLGLSQSWFTSVDPTLVAGMFFAKKARLPAWACLDCAPQWIDVHRLASAELDADTAKDVAVNGGDFERAAALLYERHRVETSHVAKFERLLRELVGSE